MDFMTFTFCLVSPASLTHGKSCTSISQLWKTRDGKFTNQRGWSCQNWHQCWMCHSAEGICYSSGQSPDHGVHTFTAVTSNILNDYFFAKSEHIHKPRDHLRTKPVQEKACFYSGTAAWSKRLHIPGLSQLESVYGEGLKQTSLISEFPEAKHATLLVYSPQTRVSSDEDCNAWLQFGSHTLEPHRWYFGEIRTKADLRDRYEASSLSSH